MVGDTALNCSLVLFSLVRFNVVLFSIVWFCLVLFSFFNKIFSTKRLCERYFVLFLS